MSFCPLPPTPTHTHTFYPLNDSRTRGGELPSAPYTITITAQSGQSVTAEIEGDILSPNLDLGIQFGGSSTASEGPKVAAFEGDDDSGTQPEAEGGR